MAPRRARETPADAQESFEQLYRGHRGEVYRAALRELGNVHDAEDVTQAAFVDAYRAVLRGTRPDAPRAWLLTIAENVRRRRLRTSLSRPREEPLDADAALAAERSEEQAGALVEALGSLTEEQRTAFLLREIAGLSYDEIATRTGSTVGSVQMLLFRARKSLRDELEPPRVQPMLVPLATLWSRFEGLRAAPRAAGAIGAAAVAIGVGAGSPAQADPEPAAPKVSTPAAVLAERSPSAAPQEIRSAPARTVRKAASPARVAKRSQSAAARPTPAAAAPEAPTQPVPSAPAGATTPAAPAAVPVRVPAPLPELELPTAELPTLEAPPLPVVPVEVAPLVDALVDGALPGGAGAAGAAGAGAPPQPVLPLDPLPPVP